MIYNRIVNTNDLDIPYLTSILKLPEISRYISIDEENYWNYVTTEENVFYFKVYLQEQLVAAIHLETVDKTLYMCIMVLPKYQQKGIASKIVKNIQNDNLPIEFDEIEISIDESNLASIKLFEKMGFTRTSQEDGLINYIYKTNNT